MAPVPVQDLDALYDEPYGSNAGGPSLARCTGRHMAREAMRHMGAYSRPRMSRTPQPTAADLLTNMDAATGRRTARNMARYMPPLNTIAPASALYGRSNGSCMPASALASRDRSGSGERSAVLSHLR